MTVRGLLVTAELLINPLIPTLKPHSNGPLYSNTVIGTLAVDEWVVTARRGMGGRCGPSPASVPTSYYSYVQSSNYYSTFLPV